MKWASSTVSADRVHARDVFFCAFQLAIDCIRFELSETDTFMSNRSGSVVGDSRDRSQWRTICVI